MVGLGDLRDFSNLNDFMSLWLRNGSAAGQGWYSNSLQVDTKWIRKSEVQAIAMGDFQLGKWTPDLNSTCGHSIALKVKFGEQSWAAGWWWVYMAESRAGYAVCIAGSLWMTEQWSFMLKVDVLQDVVCVANNVSLWVLNALLLGMEYLSPVPNICMIAALRLCSLFSRMRQPAGLKNIRPENIRIILFVSEWDKIFQAGYGWIHSGLQQTSSTVLHLIWSSDGSTAKC